MSKLHVPIAVLVGLLALLPGAAGAAPDGTCSGKEFDVFEGSSMAPSGPRLRLHLQVRISVDGAVRASGTARLPDGTTSTVLVAERSSLQASCADVDGDGAVGLTRLAFLMREPRSGATHEVTVVPDSGEADGEGRHAVTIRIGDLEAPGVARLRGRLG